MYNYTTCIYAFLLSGMLIINDQVNMGRQCSNLASLCHDMVTWLQHVIKREPPSSGITHYDEALKKMSVILSAKYTLEG